MATAIRYDVQFSEDGVSFTTLIAYDSRELANSLHKACAGWAKALNAPYWRVRPRAASTPINSPETLQRDA